MLSASARGTARREGPSDERKVTELGGLLVRFIESVDRITVSSRHWTTAMSTRPVIRRPTRRRVGLVLGPVVFVVVLLANPMAMPSPPRAVLAGTLWIAIWWMTEAIPIPATSLLPIVMFPVVGVGDVADATAPYGDPVIFLLLGGFMLALAIERWGLHHRLAVVVIDRIGTSVERLVLGFMVASAVLSMWISNSATAMLMVPIGLAVLASVDTGRSVEDNSAMVTGMSAPLAGSAKGSLGLALMLAIAYGASIGGVTTLVGSPPNAVYASVAESALGVEVGFLDWLVLAGPLGAVFLLVAWAVILRLVAPDESTLADEPDILATHRAMLGPISGGERRVAGVFGAVALAWLARPYVLEPLIPGLSDAAIAIAGSIALFLLPSGAEPGRLLSWEDVARLPWGVLILLGGGFSIAAAFQRSGLDDWIGEQLLGVGGIGALAVVAVVATTIVFLTEVNSNTATASVFMPVMAALGLELGIEPLALMATTAMAASFAFMLPVATPPNAIVFASGAVTVPQMSRVGFWLNLIAIVAIVLTITLWLPVALSIVG